MASAAPRKNKVKKTLSLEEMVQGVLESDEDESLSEFIESKSEIGDCEDEDGNHFFLFLLSQMFDYLLFLIQLIGLWCFKMRKIFYMFMGTL